MSTTQQIARISRGFGRLIVRPPAYTLDGDTLISAKGVRSRATARRIHQLRAEGRIK